MVLFAWYAESVISKENINNLDSLPVTFLIV